VEHTSQLAARRSPTTARVGKGARGQSADGRSFSDVSGEPELFNKFGSSALPTRPVVSVRRITAVAEPLHSSCRQVSLPGNRLLRGARAARSSELRTLALLRRTASRPEHAVYAPDLTAAMNSSSERAALEALRDGEPGATRPQEDALAIIRASTKCSHRSLPMIDHAYEKATVAWGVDCRRRCSCASTSWATSRRSHPVGDCFHRAQPQHPARLRLPRPRPGPHALRTPSGDRDQQPTRPHAASGVADLDTLRYFSGLVGDQLVRDETRTTGPGGQTRSENPSRRPLAPPEQLRQLPAGHALLVWGQLPPTIVPHEATAMLFHSRAMRGKSGAVIRAPIVDEKALRGSGSELAPPRYKRINGTVGT